MDIEYLKLIKIDHENNCVQSEPLNDEGNVKKYVIGNKLNISLLISMSFIYLFIISLWLIFFFKTIW